LENRKSEQVLSRGTGIRGREEEVGKGHGRINMVQILLKIFQEWGEGDKGEW
jgi:hypothetical protein